MSQLRALLALRDLASFTRAGEQLHLSPRAVFGQIRQLEDQIGLRVYERIGKRLLLTNTGLMLAEYAKGILDKHTEAWAALKEQVADTRASLRIGCPPHGSLHLLPHLLRSFLRA